jgi:hypothetical protein
VDKFGVLKRVDLRLLWPNEALDFTPWLAQNITALGEALGLDLELKAQESAVGQFSLDLLAHDLGSDRVVIIENQIEQTNHDHLGKLVTYAAGHDAAVVVWIASMFREEHRQAIDWLNQRTDTHTEFFGVVIEAVQIDESRPAYNFRLVAFPNDWRKSKVGSTTAKVSTRAQAYFAFFQNLIDRLRTEHSFTKATKGQFQSWYTFSSGTNGLVYGVSFSTKSRVRVEAYIDREDYDWNKALFDALYEQRSEIDTGLSGFGQVEWERLDSRRACRIAIYRQGSVEDPPEVLEEITNWAIPALLQFKKVIGPRATTAVTSVAQGNSMAANPGN